MVISDCWFGNAVLSLAFTGDNVLCFITESLSLIQHTLHNSLKEDVTESGCALFSSQGLINSLSFDIEQCYEVTVFR